MGGRRISHKVSNCHQLYACSLALHRRTDVNVDVSGGEEAAAEAACCHFTAYGAASTCSARDPLVNTLGCDSLA